MTAFHLDTGSAKSRCRLLLAHGAGAGIESPFLETMAALLAERDIAVTRFEFDYMASRREGGKRRPPPRADKLMSEYQNFVREVAARSPSRQLLIIGGKSLGGRVASLIADASFHDGKICGLVCLGYPFHPPGQPMMPPSGKANNLRTAHLAAMACPTLIVQGERDPFGSRTEVAALSLSPAIGVSWIDDGDHDFGPRGASGFSRKGNMTAAANAVASFLSQLKAGR